MYEKASNFTIHGGNFTEINHHGPSGIDTLLARCLPDAAYDSAARETKASCYPGTRTQYIADITDWTITFGQNARRLISMRGALGTGKTSIAQSCADKADEKGVLGASFFFWRDNGVVDPTCLFPTIAVQLSRKIRPYKAILERLVNDDPSLPMARMDTQLRELILKPFLELEREGIQVEQRVVFIDGLDEATTVDEAATKDAQSKIVELITKSIKAYGARIPLLWAIFSRPELHITNAFFDHASASSFYWEITLHASEELDNEIELYLRGTLQDGMARRTRGGLNLSSGTVQWPSDKDIQELVRASRRLFIYATTLARYIMNPNSYSPEKRLQEVLSFHSTRSALGDEQPNPVAELDALYGMIMSRIPHDILLVSQQILLLHYESLLSHKRYEERRKVVLQNPQIWVLANLAGLSLRELVDALSSLHSVLMLKQAEGPSQDQFGSATLFFHHASFMEFLVDKRRSREYWIQGQEHWSSLASRCLRLVNEMHSMNSLPRNEKTQALKALFTALPEKDWRILEFRNELYYHYLHPDLLIWCARAGLESSSRTLQGLRLLDFDAFRNFGKVFIEREELEQLLTQYPEDLRERVSQVYHIPPDDSEWDPPPDLTAPVTEICEFIIDEFDLVRCYNKSERKEELGNFIKDILTSRSTQDSRRLFSKIQDICTVRYEEAVKKAQYLDGSDLLEFYDSEWEDTWDWVYRFDWGIGRHAALRILELLESSWNTKFFEAMGKGRYCRLTETALSILTRQENGDLINRQSLTNAFGSLFDGRELPRKRGSDIDPINTIGYHRTHLEKGCLKFLSRHYAAKAVEISSNPCPLPTFLDIVDDMFHEDCSIIGLQTMDNACRSGASYLLRDFIREACVQALVDNRLEDVFTEFGRLLEKSAHNDGHLHIIYLLLFTKFQQKHRRLESLLEIFRTHVQKHALTTLSNIGVTLKDSGKGSTDPCVSALLDIRQQYLEMVKKVFDNNWQLIRSLGEAFQAVTREYPQLCHPKLERLSEQDKHEIFGYPVPDVSTSLEPFDISDVEWLQSTSGVQVVSNPVAEGSATDAQPELHQPFSHCSSISDVVVLYPVQMSEPVAGVKEEE
ncbi:Cullin-1 [Leucoagaricus sp. SymC.cos]|nr:Cullin-1 [Leucoagaricus sp. SymC.cos]